MTEKDYTRPEPCWFYVKRNTWEDQLRHVLEEIGEVVEAMHDGNTEHASEEMTDAITALTTMLEIIGCNKDKRQFIQAKVNEKNRARGYWNE